MRGPFHHIAVFVMLLCVFNYTNPATAQPNSAIQETLLPFNSVQLFIAETSEFSEAGSYYTAERHAKYDVNENESLSHFVRQKKYLNNQYYPQWTEKYYPGDPLVVYPNWYMKLKHDKPFNSYLVGGNERIYLINVDSDYHLLSDMRLDELSYQRGGVSRWHSFNIDKQLILTVQDESVIHRSFDTVDRLQMFSRQRYQITDRGNIIALPLVSKVYPSHQADYEPINPDNCIAAVVRSSPYLLNKHVLTSVTLPFSGKDYEGKIHQLIQTTGKTYPTDCYGAVAHDYLLLPNVNQHAVILFEGYDFQRHQANEVLYLVTADQERKIKDVMVIYYQRNDGKQKINFTINADYRIELQMTEPDGKVVKQTFSINQQGEFE